MEAPPQPSARCLLRFSKPGWYRHNTSWQTWWKRAPHLALWPWPWRKEILFLLKLWNSFLGVNCGDNLQSGRMQWQWLMTRLAEHGRVAKLPSYDISSRFEKSKWRPWRPFHAEESDACQQSGSNAEDDGVFSCCLLGTGTRHKICQECQAIATKRSRSQDH